VCRFITCGRYNEYNYLVMELLGDNLSELRRKTATGKFSMASTLMLGIVFVRSLEQIHDLGYLHRDVKPSNFVIGNEGRRNQVFLIDFGLARKFVMPDGSIRPARDQAGFRGTARYASINSHMSRDLGRRDDLWSVLYILIEFAKGYLPWRKLKEKDEIRDVKINMNTPELCDELPKEFLQFMDHLQALDYGDRPDYDYLIQLMRHRLKLIGSDEHSPYDWEFGQTANTLPPSASVSPDLLRPDSAGRPVMSNEGPANGDDPNNPIVYKLVAGGGRRGVNGGAAHASSSLAANNDDGYENFASSSAAIAATKEQRPLTDSAEEGRRGLYNEDNSDLGFGPDDDDDNEMSNASEKPRPKQQQQPSSVTSPTIGDTPGGPSSINNRRVSIEIGGGPKDQELEVINHHNNKPQTQRRQQPPAHGSSEKCKCTIL
jgi:serine/threonine protein kinase